MKMDVLPNTNPITPAAIASKSLSFLSGGGSGGTVIYPTGIKAGGSYTPAVVAVPPAVEASLLPFNATVIGGKPFLFQAWSVFGAGNYVMRFYVNGLMSMEVPGAIAQTLNWGFLGATLPAGVVPFGVSVLNLGGAPLSAGPVSAVVMEFL